MKTFVLAACCLVLAQQTYQHNTDGHYFAYKYGLHSSADGTVPVHEHVYGPRNNTKMAKVTLFEAGDLKDMGEVILHYDGKETILMGHVRGLTPGKHGFHIHEKGDLSNKCVGAGPHFNPENKHHGGPSDEDRHVGDLGNIVAGADGVAKFHIKDHLVALDGPHDVTGRAVVVHADPDDLGKGGQPDSLTTGHAGARVACGVIVRQ